MYKALAARFVRDWQPVRPAGPAEEEDYELWRAAVLVRSAYQNDFPGKLPTTLLLALPDTLMLRACGDPALPRGGMGFAISQASRGLCKARCMRRGAGRGPVVAVRGRAPTDQRRALV